MRLRLERFNVEPAKVRSLLRWSTTRARTAVAWRRAGARAGRTVRGAGRVTATLLAASALLWWFTGTAATQPLASPEPPSNLIAVPADLGIYLQWDASPTPVRQISEYRIERFREGDSAAVIIRRVPAGQLSHFDSTGLGGVEYRYRVRARDWFLNDSPWSDPAFATYRDPEAPAPPDSISVTVNPRGLFVDWVANQEPDLAEYRVYRAEEGQALQQVAAREQTQYLDREALTAVPYVYRVTAVDLSGNESPPSDSVLGFIPDGIPPGRVTGFVAEGTAKG
ncbi:MAG: hypothetical protein HKN29_11120, partial [Rhodothermales bacterium]|nr:hypothetical protein [Rhodothermales bacterium]